MDISAKIAAAAEYILSQTDLRPTIGLVLGSGLGEFANTLEDAVRIPFGEIPHFPVSTAPGHVGALVIGRKCGQTVLVMQGRVHFYEGHSMEAVTFPIRVMAKLGIKNLVLTNSSGGTDPNVAPGSLMLISDHINFSGTNPLMGPNLDEFGPRFPDISDLYTKALRMAVKEKAAAAGIPLEEGVYMMFIGPNYETPAEVRMARILGADAVGMSTAPGHAGVLVIGKKCGKTLAVMQGRLHFYEGHSMEALTMPIRVLAKLGIKDLVLTNSSGGVNLEMLPGSLMLISDHINFSGTNPLMGPNLDDFGPRFPDVSDLYTRELRAAVKERAAAAGLPLEEGVYMMFIGPNYETPAEIRMARILGADAVGMSTAPEALVAGHCGMRIVGVSCITCYAAGVSDQPLNHEEVEACAARASVSFRKLLELILTVF